MKWVIDHIGGRVYKWSVLEYKECSKTVGKNSLIFTNVRNKEQHKLKGLGKVYGKSVEEMGWKRVVVLDPSAKETLKPKDKGKFDYVVLGGILGEHPRKFRTRDILKGAERRNLGKKQMPTNTALHASFLIIEKGKKLSEINFKDKVTVKINGYLKVELPYRYVVRDGKPLLPEGLVEHLKKTRTI